MRYPAGHDTKVELRALLRALRRNPEEVAAWVSHAVPVPAFLDTVLTSTDKGAIRGALRVCQKLDAAMRTYNPEAPPCFLPLTSSILSGAARLRVWSPRSAARFLAFIAGVFATDPAGDALHNMHAPLLRRLAGACG
jgi:hypothetical protein